MVIHHIQYHLDSGLVKRLNHQLELLYSHARIIRIGGVAALGHIIVLRVVTPVILGHVETCLVNRRVVERRQHVHSVHAQVGQVLYGLGLGERHKFAFILQTRRCVD